MGWLLIIVSVAAIAALAQMPVTSHPYSALAGLGCLTLLGFCLQIGGPRKRYAALAMLTLGAAGGAVVLSSASFDRDSKAVPLSIDVTNSGCALTIRGDIGEDFYQRLRDALDQNQQVRAVVLTSSGGAALSITQSADLLAERGVRTAVMRDRCASACAFLWVSAPRRIIAARHRSAAPGFHAPQALLPWLGLVRVDLQEWQQKRYLRREVELPEAFIAQAYKPIRGLFEPNADELNSMGVRTEFIGSRETEKFYLCD